MVPVRGIEPAFSFSVSLPFPFSCPTTSFAFSFAFALAFALPLDLSLDGWMSSDINVRTKYYMKEEKMLPIRKSSSRYSSNLCHLMRAFSRLFMASASESRKASMSTRSTSVAGKATSMLEMRAS